MEYDAAELSSATQKYGRRNFLGKGGFGSVYRGSVRGCLDVAVKVLTQVIFPLGVGATTTLVSAILKNYLRHP